MPQQIVELRVALKPVDDSDNPPSLEARLGCIKDVLKQLRQRLEEQVKSGLMIVGYGPIKEKKSERSDLDAPGDGPGGD